MVVRPLKPACIVSMRALILVAFAAGTLSPAIVEAQATAAKPPVVAKPAQPPAKPVSPPAAKPAPLEAAKPAAPAAKPDAPAAAAPAPAANAATSTPAAPAAGPVTIASLAGTWDGVAQTPDGDMPVHMVLVHLDGKLTGSMETQMGTLAVTGSTLTGDVLELGFELQGTAGGLSGKVAGDKYEGSWSVGGDSGPFAMVRVPAPVVKK